MTDFKVGDKVNVDSLPHVWTIIAIDGKDAWCKSPSGNRGTISLWRMTKVPDFFRVGYTYKNDLGCRFNCHYVGYVGDVEDRNYYAAGQHSCPDGSEWRADMITDMESWIEL